MFSINSSPIMLLSFYKQDGCCITCILHIATCSNISVWYTKDAGSILYIYTLHLYFTKKTGRRRRISGDALCRYIGNRMCSRDLAHKHACGCTLSIGADGGCHVDAGCKAACIYGVCIG